MLVLSIFKVIIYVSMGFILGYLTKDWLKTAKIALKPEHSEEILPKVENIPSAPEMKPPNKTNFVK